jgi:hypothetical protein
MLLNRNDLLVIPLQIRWTLSRPLYINDSWLIKLSMGVFVTVSNKNWLSSPCFTCNLTIVDVRKMFNECLTCTFLDNCN